MASRTPCGLMSHAGAKSGVAGGTRERKKSQQAMDGRGCVKWRGQGPFVGHYWLQGKEPELLARNIACVSWSVAKIAAGSMPDCSAAVTCAAMADRPAGRPGWLRA